MAARPLHSHSSGPREDRATLLVLVSVPWQLVSLNELVELGARCSLGSGSWLQQHAPHRLTWRARAGLVLERSLPARAALVVLSVRSGGSSTAALPASSGAVVLPWPQPNRQPKLVAVLGRSAAPAVQRARVRAWQQPVAGGLPTMPAGIRRPSTAIPTQRGEDTPQRYQTTGCTSCTWGTTSPRRRMQSRRAS